MANMNLEYYLDNDGEIHEFITTKEKFIELMEYTFCSTAKENEDQKQYIKRINIACKLLCDSSSTVSEKLREFEKKEQGLFKTVITLAKKRWESPFVNALCGLISGTIYSNNAVHYFEVMAEDNFKLIIDLLEYPDSAEVLKKIIEYSCRDQSCKDKINTLVELILDKFNSTQNAKELDYIRSLICNIIAVNDPSTIAFFTSKKCI